MRAAALLILNYYRRRLAPSALGLVFLVLFAGATVYMALLWPTFRYLHTANSLAVRWDLRVNGPLIAEDLTAIRSAAGQGLSRMVSVNTGAAKLIGPKRSVMADLHFVGLQDVSDFGLTLAPAGLITRGSMESEASAAIDQSTLHRIGGRLGEKIAYEQTYSRPTGELSVVRGFVTPTAITGTTVQFRGLMAAETLDAGTALREAVGIDATDAYLSVDDPDSAKRAVQALAGSSEWMVLTRDEFVQQSSIAAEKAGGRAYGTVGLLVSAVLFILLLLRDMLVRIERRSASLAFAFSLGLRARDLVAVHLLEQASLILAVSVLGYSAGVSVFLATLDMYPPVTTIRMVSLMWMAACLVLLFICASQVVAHTREDRLVAAAMFRGA